MLGFCEVEEDGVPPAKVHDHEVGLLVELSVKVTASPAHTVVELAVKEATGGVEQDVTVIYPACVSVSVPLASVTVKET